MQSGKPIDHRRGRRRRGLSDARRQQDPRHLQVRRGQGPGLGDRRRPCSDIAILTGGQVISEVGPQARERRPRPRFGQARKVVDHQGRDHHRRGAGDAGPDRLAGNQIRAEIDSTDSDYDREKLQERLAKLAGGVAVIKVGRGHEVELKERRNTASGRRPQREGRAVEGASSPAVASPCCRPSRRSTSWSTALAGDEATGANIVRVASRPARQIAVNAGLEGGVVAEKVRTRAPARLRRDRDCVDMIAAGIIDLAVTRSALRITPSIAALFLTTGYGLTSREGRPDGRPAGGMGGMDPQSRPLLVALSNGPGPLRTGAVYVPVESRVPSVEVWVSESQSSREFRTFQSPAAARIPTGRPAPESGEDRDTCLSSWCASRCPGLSRNSVRVRRGRRDRSSVSTAGACRSTTASAPWAPATSRAGAPSRVMAEPRHRPRRVRGAHARQSPRVTGVRPPATSVRRPRGCLAGRAAPSATTTHPASLLGVAALGHADQLVEVEAVAGRRS